jgi:hypothetical protein
MKYVGDRIHFLNKEPHGEFLRLKIPTYRGEAREFAVRR